MNSSLLVLHLHDGLHILHREFLAEGNLDVLLLESQVLEHWDEGVGGTLSSRLQDVHVGDVTDDALPALLLILR